MEETEFLDLRVVKRFGKLQTDLFVKASDSYQHLQYGPCHARACKTDIPFALEEQE